MLRGFKITESWRITDFRRGHLFCSLGGVLLCEWGMGEHEEVFVKTI